MVGRWCQPQGRGMAPQDTLLCSQALQAAWQLCLLLTILYLCKSAAQSSSCTLQHAKRAARRHASQSVALRAPLCQESDQLAALNIEKPLHRPDPSLQMGSDAGSRGGRGLAGQARAALPVRAASEHDVKGAPQPQTGSKGPKGRACPRCTCCSCCSCCRTGGHPAVAAVVHCPSSSARPGLGVVLQCYACHEEHCAPLPAGELGSGHRSHPRLCGQLLDALPGTS